MKPKIKDIKPKIKGIKPEKEYETKDMKLENKTEN